MRQLDWSKTDNGFRCSACEMRLITKDEAPPPDLVCFGPPLRIRSAGHLTDELVLRGHMASCGSIRNGISAEFTTDRGGFVLDWNDFEAAYLALKATREEAERVFVDPFPRPPTPNGEGT